MDGLFATYAELLPALTDHLASVVPHEPGSSEAAWRRAVKARALDALRGLLPAATTSNLGIFATGQAYEALLLRLRASALPEARSYADLLLEELRQVIPAFLHRVDREDRGSPGPATWPTRPPRRPRWSRPCSATPPVHPAGPVGPAHRVRPGRRGQGPDRDRLPQPGGRGGRGGRPGGRARGRGAGPAAGRLRRRPPQPPPPSRPGVRAGRLHLRRGRRLRRLPGPPAAPDVHDRVAAAHPGLGYDLPGDVAEAGLAGRFQAAMDASAGLYAALAPGSRPRPPTRSAWLTGSGSP